MSGCMRGDSDSRLNGVFDEGRTEALAVRTPSILSTEDFMMLARVFISPKTSWDLSSTGQLRQASQRRQHGMFETYPETEAQIAIVDCESRGEGPEAGNDMLSAKIKRRTEMIYITVPASLSHRVFQRSSKFKINSVGHGQFVKLQFGDHNQLTVIQILSSSGSPVCQEV